MKQFFEKIELSTKHLKALNDFFNDRNNYKKNPEEQNNFNI